MSTHDRIVWVLGAGFSAGLGAPLLKDLFSRASSEDLFVRYSRDVPALFGPEVPFVRWLYAYGSTNDYVEIDNSQWRGELMWRNAEEFVEYLDIAAEEEASAHLAVRPRVERIATLKHRREHPTGTH